MKAESKSHKGFTVIYSHSLFVCGIVQFIATLAMLYFKSSGESSKDFYAQLMLMFGTILMSASFPVGFIIFNNWLESRKIKKEETNLEMI